MEQLIELHKLQQAGYFHMATISVIIFSLGVGTVTAVAAQRPLFANSVNANFFNCHNGRQCIASVKMYGEKKLIDGISGYQHTH